MRPGLAIAIVSVLGGVAHAQAPAAGEAPKQGPLLKVDKCGVRDPALTDAELLTRGREAYSRGETLYLQGDYIGAVDELVGSYCKIPYYSILKDIGQAYERALDYELAIAYLERYIAEIPAGAKRATQCDPDPQEDKENVGRRVSVLRGLKAHIKVQTQPGGASITLENNHRKEASGQTGEDIEVPGDTYQMKVEKAGYEPEVHEIVVQIGKPYTYSYELRPLTGTLSVQVTPADSRIFLGDRLVGIGRYDMKLDAKRYLITSERQGRLTDRREIEVLPNQNKRVQVELTPTPQFGRRQTIIFSTIAGGAIAGSLLYAFDESVISGFATLGGGTAAAVASYFYLPDNVSLGTSNLTITATLAGSVIGSTATLLFTDDQRKVQPIAGATALVGAGAGYYFGERTKIRPGDAALINSSMTWGTVAGGLFALSFAPPREVSAGLVLSGLAMGGISGSIMTRYFDISRTHAVLLDVGGIVGILGGLAVESIAYPTSSKMGEDVGEEQREHLANFALGGMAVGLIGAGILTRNLDAPKLNLQPTIGNVTATDGTSTTTYGFSGAF
ncbi:MAG: PEGA domain-containing protein [Kofleriaceae bacterium]